MFLYTPTVYKLEDLFSSIETATEHNPSSPNFYIRTDLEGFTYGKPCNMIVDFCKKHSIYNCNSEEIYFDVIEQKKGTKSIYVLFMNYQYIIGSYAICYIENPYLSKNILNKNKDVLDKL